MSRRAKLTIGQRRILLDLARRGMAARDQAEGWESEAERNRAFLATVNMERVITEKERLQAARKGVCQ